MTHKAKKVYYLHLHRKNCADLAFTTAQEEGLEVDGGSVVRDTGGDVLALTSVERSLNSVLNTLESYCRFMESVDTF